jgi:hypothetical protein
VISALFERSEQTVYDMDKLIWVSEWENVDIKNLVDKKKDLTPGGRMKVIYDTVNELLEEGLLTSDGRGKNRKYSLNEKANFRFTLDFEDIFTDSTGRRFGGRLI